MKTIYTARSGPLVAILLLLLGGIPAAASASAIEIAETARYGWAENAGWLSLREPVARVTVYIDHLEGYGWGENIGWIRFGSHSGGGSHSYANSSATNWGVNRASNGTLSGYAWSENAGWINFGTTQGGARIDPTSGKFIGYVWSENLGWIHLGAEGLTLYGIALERASFQQNQTIHFAPLADRDADAPDFTVTASATSGLDVGFSASGACTVSDSGHSSGRVTLSGVGTCTLTATQPGNTHYHPAPPVSQSFFIAFPEETVLGGGVSGGGQTVIVGSDGTIYTSSDDGESWIEQSSGIDGTIHDITWNGSQFVAVADGGQILTSSDGINWTVHQVDFGGAWPVPLYAIAWSGSRYVAVSQQGYIVTSVDGINWTSLGQPQGNNWLLDVVWSEPLRLFATVGINGVILTSPDGLTWTRRDAGVSSQWEAVAWGTPGFVAVGGVSLATVHSSNGIQWNARGEFGGPWLRDVAWLGDRYLAVGNDSTVMSSTDGIHWERLHHEPWSPTIRQIVISGEKVFLLGDGGLLFQGTLSNPLGGCSGSDVVVSRHTYRAGEAVLCEATTRLTTEGAVRVANGSAVEYRAPVIRLQPGFVAEAGSSFRAVAQNVATRTTRNVVALHPWQEQEQPPTSAKRSASGTTPSGATAQRLERADLPAALRQLLDHYAAEAWDIHASGDRERIVFTSDSALLASDQNGLPDIYLYLVEQQRLVLVSQGITGAAANGSSANPRIDSYGEQIAFDSYASDLVHGASQGGRNIFLYHVSSGLMECLSRCDQSHAGATSPTLSGDGGLLFHDQWEESGARVIIGLESDWPELSRQIVSSNRLADGQPYAASHPALDPSGRYLVYLATTSEGGCQLIWQERGAGGDHLAQPCPLPELAEQAAHPSFTANSRALEWWSGEALLLRHANPLAAP